MRGSCQQLFRFASVACCLILAACSGGGGGGGDGGSSGSNSGTLSLSTNVLTFAAHNTNSAPPSQVITATITGVTSDTLYVVVVATGPAVASISSLDFINDTTVQGTIDPESPDVLGPGVHTGTITVYACTTDPDCSAEQLAGSPQTIDVTYTITGVVASVSSLNYSVGDSPSNSGLERWFDVTAYQNWNAADNVPWLSISPVNGVTGTVTQVTASLDRSLVMGMANGTYNGTVTITPPSGAALTIPVTLTISRDPHLERGFPVQTFSTDGMYQAGPSSVFITVGNLDTDQELEILVSAYSSGPLWAFNHDGTGLDGWPEGYGPWVGYPSLGNFFGGVGQLEVAAGYGPIVASCNEDRFVFNGNGLPLPGWPVESCNAGTTSPPQIADVDGDGLDEIFFSLDAYRANGQRLGGWPPPNPQQGSLAFGDVDGDSVDEVIVASHSQIMAYEFNGSTVAGFPFQTFPITDSSKIPAGPIVTADIDGDSRCEIIEVRKLQGNPSKAFVRLFGANGSLKWENETLLGDSINYTTAPALADLDADGVPEIIVQVEGALYVWHGDGTLMSGWPVRLGEHDSIGNSSPVIGDVDGDQLPDVVIVAYRDSATTKVLVYDRNGQLHPAFPKVLPLSTSMAPAIADIDLDGRNEILVGSTQWNGYWDMYDTVFAYDLGGPAHGPILWGQVGGGPRHQYRYPPK